MGDARKQVKMLWFRAKYYGWGWYPSSWQGWAITAGYAVAYIISIILFMAWLGSAKQAAGALTARPVLLAMLEFALWIAFLSYTLIRICYRTGEPPHWRWGSKK